jgi:tRNA pseudouridine55 synthase
LGRRRRFGRKLDGVIIIDKPAGETSNAVLQRAKRLFFAEKAGHTGALDPLATGVLPLCFGEATKFSQYLLDSDKTYVSDFYFGIATDTADSDGKTLSQIDASSLTEEMLESEVSNYRGDIEQVPPMYSALKLNGQPLYKLARKGIEVERAARKVHIFEFSVLSFEPGEVARAKVRVHCSKGTYIRSLAADIGEALGLGGHVATLHREQAGSFHERDAVSLEALELERGEGRAECLDHYLLPVDAPVSNFPEIRLDDNSGFYFLQGQAVMDTRVYQLGDEGDTLRVFQDSGAFLGLAEITDDGRLAPRRLMAQS